MTMIFFLFLVGSESSFVLGSFVYVLFFRMYQVTVNLVQSEPRTFHSVQSWHSEPFNRIFLFPTKTKSSPKVKVKPHRLCLKIDTLSFSIIPKADCTFCGIYCCLHFYFILIGYNLLGSIMWHRASDRKRESMLCTTDFMSKRTSVWENFGFQVHEEGQPPNPEEAVCKLCMKKNDCKKWKHL